MEFYLDGKGHQTDTTVPPAWGCKWHGTNRTMMHWSRDCGSVAKHHQKCHR